MNDMSQRGLPLPAPKKITTVDFHGAKLLAIAGDSPETTMVAMRPIVEAMGLDWSAQFKKIAGHQVLSEGVAVTAIPSAGGVQQFTVIRLNLLHFWLATIHPGRIPDQAVRASVIRFQRECANVLMAYFFAKAQGEPTSSELDIRTNGIARMLAHKVTVLEKKLATLVPLLDNALAEIDDKMTDMQNRLTLVQVATEAHNPDRGFISPLEILEAMRVPEKGRRGLVSLVSSRLRSHCKAVKRPDDMKLSIATKRWVFSEELAQHWLAGHFDHHSR